MIPDLDQRIAELAGPRAQPAYLETLAGASEVFPRFDLTTDVRIVHFLAQALHETAGLSVLIENLNYSAERLVAVWPLRFPTIASALPFARNPSALANKVYGGRLGNVMIDDGWTFRGRGLLQITGRANYRRVSTALMMEDFVTSPDLVLTADRGLSVACCLWQLLRGNEAADTDDVVVVTKRINGGTVGLADRTAWVDKIRQKFGFTNGNQR